MVGLWLVFTLMLFVLEPAFLHRWFLTRAKVVPEATFRLIHGLHWLLLSLSIITIFAAGRWQSRLPAFRLAMTD